MPSQPVNSSASLRVVPRARCNSATTRAVLVGVLPLVIFAVDFFAVVFFAFLAAMGISSVLGHSERLCSSNSEAQECIPILFVCDFSRTVRLTYSDESTAMARLCFDLGDRSDTTNVTPVFVVHGQHRTAIIDAIIGLELIGIRRGRRGSGRFFGVVSISQHVRVLPTTAVRARSGGPFTAPLSGVRCAPAVACDRVAPVRR